MCILIRLHTLMSEGRLTWLRWGYYNACKASFKKTEMRFYPCIYVSCGFRQKKKISFFKHVCIAGGTSDEATNRNTEAVPYISGMLLLQFKILLDRGDSSLA